MNIEAIATLIAVVLGWVLSELSRGRADRHHAQNKVRCARAACIDRLERLKSASDDERENEKWFLGSDLNSYRDSLASAHAETSADWEVFQRVRLILRADLDRIDKVAKEDRIDEVVKELQVLASQKVERHYG